MKKKLTMLKRNGLRSLTFGLLLTGLASTANAQKDLSVRLMQPATGDEIVMGMPDSVKVMIKNTGMMNIGMTDTIALMINVGGSMAYMGGTMCMLNTGDSIALLIPSFSYSNFMSNADNVSFCTDVAIMSNTDPTPVNNSSCNNVNLRMSPTAIANIPSASLVTMFPNPANAILNVTYTEMTEGIMTLFDVTGKEMDRVALTMGSNIIKTANYPAGMYYYKLLNKQGQALQNGKVIISH